MAKEWEPGIHRGAVEGAYANLDVSDVVRVELDSSGFGGNWEGVYYDPSDLYDRSKANHFEGTVYGCRHLEGHYYHCSYDLSVF
ncbi:hypothetical protein [Qipengyuania sp. DGS5-3]|uniref:hypothetical protein n=1 Tax=Qipengyuania sp. DGS5-3 TaxID=3349632 RepID=UPI0036D2D24A